MLPQGKIKNIYILHYSWHTHLKKNKCSAFSWFSNICLLPRFLLGLVSFVCGTHTSLSELHCCCLCFLVWMLKRPSVTCSSSCIDFLCILLCTGPDTVVFFSVSHRLCHFCTNWAPRYLLHGAWSATGIFLWKGNMKHVTTCTVYLCLHNKPPQILMAWIRSHIIIHESMGHQFWQDKAGIVHLCLTQFWLDSWTRAAGC